MKVCDTTTQTAKVCDTTTQTVKVCDSTTHTLKISDSITQTVKVVTQQLRLNVSDSTIPDYEGMQLNNSDCEGM